MRAGAAELELCAAGAGIRVALAALERGDTEGAIAEINEASRALGRALAAAPLNRKNATPAPK